MTEARLTLPPEPSSVRAARSLVEETLAGTPAEDCSDAAGLLVSELATNALVHARSTLRVCVRVQDDRVRVEVEDQAQTMPALHVEQGDLMTGRGLQLVDGLADGWGADRLEGGGKAVWFELSYDQ